MNIIQLKRIISEELKKVLREDTPDLSTGGMTPEEKARADAQARRSKQDKINVGSALVWGRQLTPVKYRKLLEDIDRVYMSGPTREEREEEDWDPSYFTQERQDVYAYIKQLANESINQTIQPSRASLLASISAKRFMNIGKSRREGVKQALIDSGYELSENYSEATPVKGTAVRPTKQVPKKPVIKPELPTKTYNR